MPSSRIHGSISARRFSPLLPLATFVSLALPGLALPAQMSPVSARATLTSEAVPAPSHPSPPDLAALAPLPDSPGSTLVSGSSTPDDLPSSSSTSVPDLSGFAPAPGAAGQNVHSTVSTPAGRSDKYIAPGQQAPSLTSGDKVRLGLKDAVSPFAFFGWISSAAYSQAINSVPNYGQGWVPFAQRFGASAARASTEGVLSDSVFAPVFHEDPRYYRLGPGHSFVHRTLYSVSRVVITRADSGRATPNFSLVAGNAAGSILTNAYYPQANRNVKDTAQTFAGSIGGSALGFFVSEFLSDTLRVVHLSKSE